MMKHLYKLCWDDRKNSPTAKRQCHEAEYEKCNKTIRIYYRSPGLGLCQNYPKDLGQNGEANSENDKFSNTKLPQDKTCNDGISSSSGQSSKKRRKGDRKRWDQDPYNQGNGIPARAIITLTKTDDTNFGITISAYKQKRIRVAGLKPGSPAQRNDVLEKGDFILSVNGQKLTKAVPCYVENLLGNNRNHIQLEIEYLLPSINETRNQSGFLYIEHQDAYDIPLKDSHGRSANNNIHNKTYTGTHFVKQFKVKLRKDDENSNFGFVVRGGRQPVYANSIPFIVTSVRPGSPADRDGSIKPGDRLLFIDNLNLENTTLTEVISLVKHYDQEALFTFAYDTIFYEKIIENRIIEIEIEKPIGASLGITLANPLTYKNNLVQCKQFPKIRRVKLASIADRCGMLSPNDLIVSIDGVSTSGISTAETLRLIKYNTPCGTGSINGPSIAQNSRTIKLGILKCPIENMGNGKNANCNGYIPNGVTNRDNHETVDGIIRRAIKDQTHKDMPEKFSLSSESTTTSCDTTSEYHATNGIVTRNGLLHRRCRRDKRRIYESQSSTNSSNQFYNSLQVTHTESMDIVLKYGEQGLGVALQNKTTSNGSGNKLYTFISNIDPDSAAEKSGVLHIGDKILEVNHVKTENLTAQRVAEMIKESSPVIGHQTESKDYHTYKYCRLTIEFQVMESIIATAGTFSIQIPKRGSADIGVRLLSPFDRKNGEPLIISDVRKGSLAYRSGIPKPGDRCLSINDIPITNLNLSQATKLISDSTNIVKFEIQKLPKSQPKDERQVTVSNTDNATNQLIFGGEGEPLLNSTAVTSPNHQTPLPPKFRLQAMEDYLFEVPYARRHTNRPTPSKNLSQARVTNSTFRECKDEHELLRGVNNLAGPINETVAYRTARQTPQYSSLRDYNKEGSGYPWNRNCRQRWLNSDSEIPNSPGHNIDQKLHIAEINLKSTIKDYHLSNQKEDHTHQAQSSDAPRLRGQSYKTDKDLSANMLKPAPQNGFNQEHLEINNSVWRHPQHQNNNSKRQGFVWIDSRAETPDNGLNNVKNIRYAGGDSQRIYADHVYVNSDSQHNYGNILAHDGEGVNKNIDDCFPNSFKCNYCNCLNERMIPVGGNDYRIVDRQRLINKGYVSDVQTTKQPFRAFEHCVNSRHLLDGDRNLVFSPDGAVNDLKIDMLRIPPNGPFTYFHGKDNRLLVGQQYQDDFSHGKTDITASNRIMPVALTNVATNNNSVHLQISENNNDTPVQSVDSAVESLDSSGNDANSNHQQLMMTQMQQMPLLAPLVINHAIPHWPPGRINNIEQNKSLSAVCHNCSIKGFAPLDQRMMQPAAGSKNSYHHAKSVSDCCGGRYGSSGEDQKNYSIGSRHVMTTDHHLQEMKNYWCQKYGPSYVKVDDVREPPSLKGQWNDAAPKIITTATSKATKLEKESTLTDDMINEKHWNHLFDNERSLSETDWLKHIEKTILGLSVEDPTSMASSLHRHSNAQLASSEMRPYQANVAVWNRDNKFRSITECQTEDERHKLPLEYQRSLSLKSIQHGNLKCNHYKILRNLPSSQNKTIPTLSDMVDTVSTNTLIDHNAKAHSVNRVIDHPGINEHRQYDMENNTASSSVSTLNTVIDTYPIKVVRTHSTSLDEQTQQTNLGCQINRTHQDAKTYVEKSFLGNPLTDYTKNHSNIYPQNGEGENIQNFPERLHNNIGENDIRSLDGPYTRTNGYFKDKMHVPNGIINLQTKCNLINTM